MWGILLLLLILPVAISAAILVLPLGEDKSIWALYAFVSLLHVSVAILYITGLKAFKYEFRIGYWYLAASMVLYAIGVLELPIFKDIILESEGGALKPIYYTAILPVVFGVILYYLGLRKIASIIAVRTILLSRIFIGGAAVVIGGAVAASTIFTSKDSESLSLAIPLGVLGVALTCVLASAALLVKLRRGVSALYKPAFAWSFYGFLTLFIGQILDPTPFLPSDHWYVEYSLAVPLLPSALCFLKGAFEFSRIPYKEGELMKHADTGQQLTSIDIILAVAQLVSNPTTIDPELDKLRTLTSQRQHDQPLTDQQQNELADLYQHLETFLIQKEPTRNYTAHWLRQMVDVRFRGSVNEPTFWQRFQTLPAETAGNQTSTPPNAA